MLLTPAQNKRKSFESRRNSFIFFLFTRGGCVSCLRACLGTKLLPQSYQYPNSKQWFTTYFLQEAGAGKRCSECDQYPNLSEGADRVGGELRRDKECPFSGVTKFGRVWRKVPENCARSVCIPSVLQEGSFRNVIAVNSYSGARLERIPSILRATRKSSALQWSWRRFIGDWIAGRQQL